MLQNMNPGEHAGMPMHGSMADQWKAEAERYKADYLRACKTVADMHAAATGRPGEEPRRGVVEDVADLRAALRELLARAEADICDPIDVPEIQQARWVLGAA